MIHIPGDRQVCRENSVNYKTDRLHKNQHCCDEIVVGTQDTTFDYNEDKHTPVFPAGDCHVNVTNNHLEESAV